MLKQKRHLMMVAGLVVLVLIMAGFVVTRAQSQGGPAIGVVNMEAVYTQYMAPPLFTARDQMQQEFDEVAEDLTEEERADIFIEYQERLETLESEYQVRIDEAVAAVAEANGLSMLVDSGAVLYGGTDMTQAVLDVLR